MVAVKKDERTGEALGTGRRKSSVARVRIRPGSGKVTVNKRPLEDYFATLSDQNDVLAPLKLLGKETEIDINVRVNGGGSTGQSGAIRMGLARALVGYDSEFFEPLRDSGFLTRDSRMKERKKPGLHGARRGTQFSKR
ncbi:MAG: 30S ribosomal protein S9 [bacterium]|nr:30S ribosomal protein S9 [bacterium]